AACTTALRRQRGAEGAPRARGRSAEIAARRARRAPHSASSRGEVVLTWCSGLVKGRRGVQSAPCVRCIPGLSRGSVANGRPSRLAVDQTLAHQRLEVHLEGLHAVHLAATLHQLFETWVALRTLDGFAHRAGGHQHLCGEHYPVAVRAWQEPLSDDALQRVPQTLS